MEDLLEALELAAGEVLGHVGLPVRVDVARLHPGERGRAMFTVGPGHARFTPEN
jgi:hypothetical protein